jgi:hypothetical protein
MVTVSHHTDGYGVCLKPEGVCERCHFNARENESAFSKPACRAIAVVRYPFLNGGPFQPLPLNIFIDADAEISRKPPVKGILQQGGRPDSGYR